MRHGRGKQYRDAKCEYDGEWVCDKKDGHGVYKLPDGAEYEGAFKADLMHGEGKMTAKDGRSYIGEWKKGR